MNWEGRVAYRPLTNIKRMRFQQLAAKSLESTELLLKVKLDLTSEVFYREYHLARYKDNTFLIFMTTNEYDQEYELQQLSEDWTILNKLDDIIMSFENIPTLDIQGQSREELRRQLPQFLHFEPEYLNPKIHSIFSEHIDQHLIEEIAGTSAIYQHNLKQWITYLNIS